MSKSRKNLFSLFTLLIMLCLLLLPASAKAASVKLNKTTLSLSVGEKSTLKISGTSSKVTWSSSKKSVATVTSNGVVKGVAAGTTTIKAKVNGKTYTCTVTVMKLNKATLSVTMGKTSTLKVSGTSKTVTWSSSDTSVATVTSKGVVKGVFPGTATIKAKVNGKTYSCKVTVKNASASAKSLKFKTTDGGVFISGASNATVSFYLNATSANVVVSVKSSSDSTVYKKTYTKCTKGKTYSFTWNGKKSSGSAVSAGTYTVTVKAGSTTTTSSSLVVKKQVFNGGTGSKSNPFQVASWAQFLKVAEYNGYYFKQTADIDCGYTTFAGMFSESVPFTGTYDGNGKTISNLFLANSSSDQLGLFVVSAGTIKNMNLYNVNVTGSKLAAILVRRNDGTVSNCTIDKCGIASSLSNSDVFNGIVVQENSEGATVTGCTVTNSTISGTAGWYHIWSGGIIGHNYGNMIDCVIRSSIVTTTSTSYGWTQGGGLAAYNSGNMMNCTADGVSIVQKSGNCTWSAGIASENRGLISGCSFVNGTADNTGVQFQNGTLV